MKPLILLIALIALIASGLPASAQSDPAEAGPKVVAEAFGKLSGALGEAIATAGPANALDVCSERAPRIAEEVGQAHGVVVRRASVKPRNPKNAASVFEKASLEEFARALAKEEEPKPRVLANADGSMAFLAPIVIGNALCLQCHGTPGGDIAPETGAAIRRLYPEDKATGYQLGDLRGLWHVTFPSDGEASVKPGINEGFLKPDLKVDEWTQKFETESREVFHLRKEIVAALGLKPGMSVADIGAGTGLFTLPFSEAVGEEGKSTSSGFRVKAVTLSWATCVPGRKSSRPRSSPPALRRWMK